MPLHQLWVVTFILSKRLKWYTTPMNTQTTPKDFFLHLGATIVLYIAGISLINLSFSIINYLRPDALAGYFNGGSVAWPISMLVILVPLLYVLEWMIARDLSNNPEKKDIWVRRWRIYLTLFLTGAVIIGDLITLLNTYLNGEITSRLVYKVIAVLIIAGTIFAYYLLDLTGKKAIRKTWRSVLFWVGLVIVLAAIVGGFIVVGPPATQRALRFDQQRINDLSSIQWQVINNWQTKGIVPATLEELRDPLMGFTIPTDPETMAPYGYTRVASTTFELCATFGRPSQDLKGRGEFGYGYDGGLISRPSPAYYPGFEGEQWDHEAGVSCFERKIDPDRFPITPKPMPM
jgi:hypothetical protein